MSARKGQTNQTESERQFKRAANDPVQRILLLLGPVVLIPVRPLTKKPINYRWQKTMPASMKDPAYLDSFTGMNVGVLLGNASGGLCTMDLDNDSDIEAFLKANPRLRKTTQTKRVRGRNFWVYVDGEIPRSARLKDGGRYFGEWRADGNQTLIFGSATDKTKGETKPTEYRFLNEVPPIHIRFDELVFPKGNFFKRKPRLNSASCVSASLHPCIPASLDVCISTSLHNKDEAEHVLGNIKAKQEAMDSIRAKHPNLARLYTTFIESRFQARAHARNEFIVQAVPFLYRAVAPEFVLDLVGCFYDCNRALFHDSRDQHLREAKAMLESVTKTYAENLGAAERGIYDALPQHEQNAFHICRDLASLTAKDREPNTFFLSFNHLADRLGIFPVQAQRIMRQLEVYGLIKLMKKGTRRAAGVRGEAGTYQWLLPPPKP